MSIDRDKLLELVNAHEDSTCRIDTRIIRDAIDSGELAAQRVYAKVPDGFVGTGSIMGGNMFEVYNDDGEGFHFVVDGLDQYANWRGSNHLNGGNWERVEK